MTPLSEDQARALAGKLSPEVLQAQADRRRLWSDYAAFVRAAWPFIQADDEQLEWAPYLDVICRELQALANGTSRRLLVNIPPRTLKSVCFSIMFQPWVWLTQPSKKIIYCSYEQGLLDGFSAKVQTLIYTDWYQKLIPARFGPNKNEKWAISEKRESIRYFENTEGGSRFSTTVRGALTGFGGQIIFVDDPMKAKEATQKTVRDEVNAWYYNTLPSRFNDPRTGALAVIMQRLHEDDLTGHILAKEGDNYKKLIFPLEYDPEAAETLGVVDDPRTIAGEPLSPRYTPEVIDGLKISYSAHDYSAQFQQNPTPGDGGMFDLSRVTFWYDDSASAKPPALHVEPGAATACRQVPIPKGGWTTMLSAWDLTFGVSVHGDFVAGIVAARHKDGGMWILDIIHEKLDFTQTVEAIKACKAKHRRMTGIYIEKAANGAAVIQTLEKSIPGIVPIKVRMGKVERANAASPFFAAGNVYLPHPKHATLGSKTQKWLAEHRGFPFAKHDDLVDATTYALIELNTSNAWAIRALAKLRY